MRDLIKDYQELIKTEAYSDYIKNNQDAFLFACFLTNSEWQFDFFSNNKVTIFKSGKLEKTDDIINTTGEIKKLDINKIKIKVEEAIEIARKALKAHNDETDKRIILLQNINSKAVWNLTLLTKHMNIMNIKVDSENGKIIGKSFQSIFKLKK